MSLAQDGKGNKKSFYRYVSTKRKTWGNGPAAKLEWDLVTMGTEEAEVLNATFVPFFINKIYLQEFQAPEVSGKVQSKEDQGPPQLMRIRLKEHLNKLDTHKSF